MAATAELPPLTWVQCGTLTCPACDDLVEVPDQCQGGWSQVGDDARCPGCPWEGAVCADEGGAWLSQGNIDELDDEEPS